MKVYYLSLKKNTPCRDYWDYGFLDDFIAGRMWQPPTWEGFDAEEVSRLPKTERALVIIPARHHADMLDPINKELSKIDRVVLFLMGDEEADFPVEQINHSNISIWVQNPHMGRHDAYNRIGTGYPQAIRQMDGTPTPVKSTDLFFSGQITHDRRQELQRFMPSIPNRSIDWTPTKGFTEGMPHAEYYARMSQAKIAPAPSGAVIVDSFRLFEALELMCIPVADETAPTGEMVGYWEWLFGEIVPFATLKTWKSLVGYTEELLDAWPHNMHAITAWWLAYKRSFAYKVMEQLHA